MIHYENGGRYYHAEEGDEFALTQEEWRRLQRAKRSIRLYTESGMPVIIRLQRADEHEGEGEEPR